MCRFRVTFAIGEIAAENERRNIEAVWCAAAAG